MRLPPTELPAPPSNSIDVVAAIRALEARMAEVRAQAVTATMKADAAAAVAAAETTTLLILYA